MGLFNGRIRNHDGASGKGEPVNTVSAKAARGLKREAARHGCNTTGELFAAPGLTQGHPFDPKQAHKN